ncbi:MULTISPECIES: hypothetical protein [Neorhizobium]|jgi:hypothetical protein|uniref:hypothetical protein n=1 Tax=Neorhizobium TaxID=1525371 RepID=UPI000560F174|nr:MULTISPECIES: hypothetical protein [Neorhizobium]CDZ27235.1 Hypothetical protein NGAL_HAMBI490_20780 [Neorhizobium galegae bv. officinalis]KAA9385079.1 hypothetical protein F4V88_00675 [Neorhizobium galegae]KAB1110582.1 hypothetical protein F4V89_23575 [Neorhizobium galegae]MCM2497814.1 hypothetical protein [Neorhizobium galegae]MCQ1773630.1 hypothetical protein [Neorhizobium galegae]
MLAALPLMIIPFILYNLGMLGILGGGGVASLGNVISSLQMLSGAVWTMTLGDVIIVISLVFLFVEILKASRNGRGSLINHMLSMLVFIAYLVEFLLVRDAATQIFFILMTITFVDVIGGFAVAIRAAGRDVSIGL